MSRLRFAFEDDSSDDMNLDTEARIGDTNEDAPLPQDGEGDASATDDGDEEADPADNAPDPDGPLELHKPEDLRVMELDDLLNKEALKDKTGEVVKAVVDDGHLVLQDLDHAMEQFLNVKKHLAVGPLVVAAECYAKAQERIGIAHPTVLQVAGLELGQIDVTAAMESIGTTLSTVIKTIMAAIRKALVFLKQVMKDIWRHLRSLEDAIKKRGDELIKFRKLNLRRLDAYFQSLGVDRDQYVQMGKHKAFLTIAGRTPVPDNQIGNFAAHFQRLNKLVATALKYEAFLSPLAPILEQVLVLVKDSADGNFDAADLAQALDKVPNLQTLQPEGPYEEAVHAHGVQAPDGCVLMVSQEFLGNFFQVVTWPNDPAAFDSALARYAATKIEYKRDETLELTNDFMRVLETTEVEDAQKAANLQAQLLISMQRVGDSVEHKLDGLADFLKKVDAQVWQNNQGNPDVAARKNQILIDLTRAVSTIEGNCSRFFLEVGSQVRSVQYAWYAYLTANLKREMEILQQGLAEGTAVKKEGAPTPGTSPA
jgi:hypothetical protein